MESLKLDIKGAMAMVGQAQERCKPKSGLWKELVNLYDQLDLIVEDIEAGDYRKDVLKEKA